MKTILMHLLPNIILAFSAILVWHILLNKKVEYKNPKIYISILIQSIISTFNYFIINKFIRIMLITVIFMFICKYLFKENIRKTILTPIFYQIIVLVTETISVLIMSFIFKEEILPFIQSFSGIILTNICVGALSVMIVRLGFIKKLYNIILSVTDRIKLPQLIMFCSLAFMVLNIFAMNGYYKIDPKYWLIISVLLILVFCIIVIYSLKTQNKFNKVSDKYNIAINSLNNYESMMTKYRIANHENKNLLLTIRAMILNKEKDIPKYIDSMVENKYNDDEKLFFDMSVIPSGGLRATIYSEVMKIIENKISYNLDIDKRIKTIDLIELDTNTIIDICKIIGVFIDNSLDEVKKLKNKNIQISLYLENKRLCIKVSNNYKGKLELDKINNEGYTTKGKNRGYGLSLVEQIVNRNNFLEHKTEINNNSFSQIISIKYKKSQ